VAATGLVPWPLAAAVAGLLATALALKDVVSASRAVWHAVEQVAQEAEMTPLRSDETRAPAMRVVKLPSAD
jgi:hypothetical protein